MLLILIKTIYFSINKNKFTFLIIALYAFLMLTVIRWGIPSDSHPYNYHMDEWHQLQSVRALFKHGSPNIPGAAHGTIFHFFISGIYLIPFVMLKIVDPFAIKSALSSLQTQETLFILLRLNTLIFGILCLIILSKIAKKYLSLNPILPLLFFVSTPIWLSLSNFFKYDIALIFWITTSLLFIFRYASNPNLTNFLLAGIFSSIAFATKLSAISLLIIYIFSFFYYTPSIRKKYTHLFIGLGVFLVVFTFFGVPDLLLLRGDYSEFLQSNLVESPKSSDNFLLDPKPWWLYLFIRVIPFDFGYAFWFISIIALIYWIALVFRHNLKKRDIFYKNIFFLLFSLAIFIISLLPLKFYAGGNRMLVFLPFLTLIISLFIEAVKVKLRGSLKKAFMLLIGCAIVLQVLQSFSTLYMKWEVDVRSSSSDWIEKHISKSTIIGIENIPIYQALPDIVVKEFYSKQQNPKYKTSFNYEVIDVNSKWLPNVVIITNRELHEHYLKTSPKKILLGRLKKENYKKLSEFKPPEILYRIMGNELGFLASGIVPGGTITIFQR